MPDQLLTLTDSGLYCPRGDFYIDPWRPVTRAVITHAHADHARPGSARYLTTPTGRYLLRPRVQPGALIRALPYGERLSLNGVDISLHPSGHLLGSAQVRVAHRGEVWVVTGDYKVEQDATCEPFELVPCHTLITESTFGLPIFRWRPQAEVLTEINAWWHDNQANGRTSILFAYALGKAQRLLAGVDSTIGPILVHGTVQRFVTAYQHAGVALPNVLYADDQAAKAHRGTALVIAPPSAAASGGWLRKFGPASLAFASGWMQIRGTRRRRAVDRGFVLSDHADWPGLHQVIHASGAEQVGVTHGYVAQMVRYLNESGTHAFALQTRYHSESDSESEDEETADMPEETKLEDAAIRNEPASDLDVADFVSPVQHDNHS